MFQEEAEQLYVQCERYDLLNKLYQSQGKLDQALKIAENKDRINFRNTAYMCAKSLEEEGNFEEAIIHYERANTCHNIPPMLLERPQQLQAYMEKTTDLYVFCKEFLRMKKISKYFQIRTIKTTSLGAIIKLVNKIR